MKLKIYQKIIRLFKYKKASDFRKEKLIFNIMKIVKENKSEFAYPSTSLYVESMPK